MIKKPDAQEIWLYHSIIILFSTIESSLSQKCGGSSRASVGPWSHYHMNTGTFIAVMHVFVWDPLPEGINLDILPLA